MLNRIAQDVKIEDFIGSVGAIDGTLLPATVKGSSSDGTRDGGERVYRCRGGWLAINALG